MNATDPTFEPFEQRLVGVLAAESATVLPPVDGLAQIRARVARRRRARRATWVAAAAALALVVGIAGALLRSSTTDSAPYVGTDSAGAMPLLGFGEGEWSVYQYAPGISYLVVDGRRDEPSGRYLQLLNAESDLGIGRFTWDAVDTIRLGDRTVGVGTQTTDDGLGNVTTMAAAWWDLGGGWRATVTGGSDATSPSSPEALASLAGGVVDVPRDDWERRFLGSTPWARSLEEPLLVLDPDAGGTQLIALSGNAFTSWLTPDAIGLEDVMLTALAPGVERDYLDQPEPVPVRGGAGSYSAGRAGDRAKLLWVEGDQAYVLDADPGTTADELSSLAARLVTPSIRDWEQLVFPDGPRDFPDAPVFRSEPAGSGP